MINTETYNLINRYVHFFVPRLPGLSQVDPQDLAHDVVIKFLRFDYLKRFDDSQASYNYYVALGVKRVLLDRLRALSCRRVELTASSVKPSDTPEIAPVRDQTLDRVYLSQIFKYLEVKSPKRGAWRETPLGRMQVSVAAVYLLHIHQCSKAEIARILKIALNTVSIYLSQAIRLLRRFNRPANLTH